LYSMGTLWHTCATVPQSLELQFGVVRAVGRGIAILHGVHIMQREGEVLGVFVPHFHNGKCHWVADGEMFPICMRKPENISVLQMYRWKARFVGFLAIYLVSTSTSGLMRNLQNSNNCSTKTQMQAENCCCPCCDNSRCQRAACIFMNNNNNNNT